MADNNTPKPKPKVQKQPSGLFQGLQGQQGQGLKAPQLQGLKAPQFQGITAQQFQGVTAPMLSGLQNLFSGVFGNKPAADKPTNLTPLNMGDLAKQAFPLSQAPEQAAQRERTFADYLQAAMEMIGGGGGSSPGRVSYDSERNTLRQNYGDADARLAAMYRQLGDSIAADAPAIQQAYQGGIDTTKQNAATAQTQTQNASNAADDRNNAVLANLGISDANKQIIAQGRDLNTQTAGNVARQAAKGQAATDLLASNQASALAHNANIKSAAGLEGATQRAQAQYKLAQLLSQLDSKEQDANAQLQASGRSNGLAQALQIAQQMAGFDQSAQNRNDKLSYQAAQLAQKQTPKTLPDLGTYLKALGITPADLSQNPRDYGSLLSALRGFNLTQ